MYIKISILIRDLIYLFRCKKADLPFVSAARKNAITKDEKIPESEAIEIEYRDMNSSTTQPQSTSSNVIFHFYSNILY